MKRIKRIIIVILIGIVIINGKEVKATDYLPINYSTVRYTGNVRANDPNTGTTVHYAIIPSYYHPGLRMARGNNTRMGNQTPLENANQIGATLAINLGLRNGGVIFTEGTRVVSTNVSYGDTLYMDKNGLLHSVHNRDYTAEQIFALNPEWAVKGFFSIYDNNRFIEEYDDVETDYVVNQRHPRSFIGQDNSGNYFVGIVEGRTTNDAGMYLDEIYDFVKRYITTDIRIIYNGDGGQSISFIYKGNRINSYGGKERPNIIYWKAYKKTIYFNSNTGKGNMEKQEYYQGTPLNIKNCTFTKDGYNFIGWSDKQDGKGFQYKNAENIANIKMSGDEITLYAIWTKQTKKEENTKEEEKQEEEEQEEKQEENNKEELEDKKKIEKQISEEKNTIYTPEKKKQEEEKEKKNYLFLKIIPIITLTIITLIFIYLYKNNTKKKPIE